MINREELAWAAGFFDGEGYTGLAKFSGKTGDNRYPVLTIAQAGTGEELQRFNMAIGNLGKVRGPYGPYHARQKPYYQLAVTSFERVQAVIAMLWDFLCSEKRVQAQHALQQYRGQLPKTKQSLKSHCPKGHAYTGDNLYIAPKTGYRGCRICRSMAVKKGSAA